MHAVPLIVVVEMPAFCSHTALDCSKRLCADVGRDLILPPRLFLHSKRSSHLHEKTPERICPYLLADTSSRSGSDMSADSGTSWGRSTHDLKQSTVVPATDVIIECTPNQPKRPKSCPTGTRLHRSGFSERPSSGLSLSTRRDRNALLTESSHISRTKLSPQSSCASVSSSLSQNISSLAQRRQRSSYSRSVVLESKISRSATARPSSAVSAYNGDHYSLSSDSNDDVFIRLSRPKFSVIKNHQPDVSAKQQHSTVSIELFERLSVPKVVPEPLVTLSNQRDSRPVNIALFERLAQPKSRNSRNSSVFSQSLDVPVFSDPLESRCTSSQSSRQNDHRSSLAVHLMPQSGSRVRRHAGVTNSSNHYAGLLTSDTIFEVDEDYRSRLLSQCSLNAVDVTREASDLLSSFRQTTDSIDDLRLLSLDDEIEDERDVFLSSMDSSATQRSASERIEEVPYSIQYKLV